MSTPKPHIHSLNSYLIKLQSSFLDTQSLAHLAQTSLFFRNDTSFKRLLKATELLDCVINVNEVKRVRIQKILEDEKADISSASLRSIILIRTNGLVKYFSSKKNKLMPRAEFIDFSPIEAAAFCGDFFLVDLFKDFLPDDSQKYAAGLQLQKLSCRKDFLSHFLMVQAGYHNILKEHPALEAARKWRTIGKNLGNFAELQKCLSNFGLQAFCNLISHVPVPDFSQEPKRKMLLYYDDKELDLDSIGSDTKLVLQKGRSYGAKLWSASQSAQISVNVGGHSPSEDAKAWDILCSTIRNKLTDITSLLLKHEPKNVKDKLFDSKGFGSKIQEKVGFLPSYNITKTKSHKLNPHITDKNFEPTEKKNVTVDKH